MKKLMLPIIAVCCFAPAAAFAVQHPLLTDKAETVAPKAFEAETAVEYAKGPFGKVFTLQETVTAGIIPKLDAYLVLPFKSVKVDGSRSESGLGDFLVGAKWNFGHIEQVQLSVKPELLLPVGDEDEGLGHGKVGIGATLIASTELSNKIGIDANIGLKHQDQKHIESYNEFNLSVAAKYNETEKLKAVSELALVTTDETGVDARAYLTVGGVYEAQKNLDLDLGLRLGLTSDSEDYVLLGAVTYKF